MLSNNSFGFISQGTSGGGGGGGTISTDDLTILGNGDSMNPLFNTSGMPQISTTNDDETFGVTTGYVYYVPNNNCVAEFGSGFPNGRCRIVNKSNTKVSLQFIAYPIYYQGTNVVVTEVPLNMVYDFILDVTNSRWRCLPITPMPIYELNIIDLSISIQYNGFYYTNSNGDVGNQIAFPNPLFYKGLIIYIFNYSEFGISISSGESDFLPIDQKGDDIVTIQDYSSYQFISDGYYWCLLTKFTTPP